MGKEKMIGIRLLVLLVLFAAGPTTLASPTIEVISLQIVRASPDGFQPEVTLVEFEVSVPDARILGLSEDSAIESWTDDEGKNLLQEAEAPPDDMGMGQVVSRVINNIRHDRVSVNRQGDRVLVTAVTGARPSMGAGSLSIDGHLILEVAGIGEQTVTLENVSLEGDGFGRIRFEVNGKQLGCSLDSASGTPDRKVSRFYCYGPELRPLRIVARGSDVDVPAGDARPNLIVVGPVENLTIDVVLPAAEDLPVLLDLDVGLGLGG